MTIAIAIMMLVNILVLIRLTTIIFEVRDGVQNYYPSLVKIMTEQRDVLQSTLDSINRWSDLSSDIISHIERVEDMEGDIKDIFEWIHSVDNNVADMRRDIQDTETKLGDLMAVHDRNALTFFNDLQSLQKDITEIKTSIDTNAYWKIRSAIENVDTDGDSPTSIIIGHDDYPTFMSKKMNIELEGDATDDNNRTE